MFRERVEVRGILGKIDFSRLTDSQLSRIAAGEHPWAVLAPTRNLLEPRNLSTTMRHSSGSIREQFPVW